MPLILSEHTKPQMLLQKQRNNEEKSRRFYFELREFIFKPAISLNKWHKDFFYCTLCGCFTYAEPDWKHANKARM